MFFSHELPQDSEKEICTRFNKLMVILSFRGKLERFITHFSFYDAVKMEKTLDKQPRRTAFVRQPGM